MLLPLSNNCVQHIVSAVFPKKLFRGGLGASFGLSRGCLHSSLDESEGGRKSHQQNQEYSDDLKFSIPDKWVRTRDAICEIGVYIYKCIYIYT